jgi:L-asparaginase/Glu-tRNA(Gln) amidotransferase subunit D
MSLRVRHLHHVGLVLTGGTIGSVLTGPEDDEIVRLSAVDRGDSFDSSDDVLSPIGQLRDVDFRVRRPIGLLSENLVPQDWLAIASATRELVDDESVEGVLILHGTDTMAYTAAALSFLLADVKVPIVLTGSNLPPTAPSSDATKNVRDAIVALRHLGNGVFVVFAGRPTEDGWIHLGTRVRKVRASGQAFETVNGLPVGKVRSSRVIALHDHPDPSPVPLAQSLVDGRVLGLRVYPGLDFSALTAAIEQGDIRGVVMEMYASATAPALAGKYSFPDFVARCGERGIPVFTALSATPEGKLKHYESGLAAAEAGATFLGDMLPETALVKLMWCLAQQPAHDPTALMLRPVFAESSPVGT